MKLTPAYVRAEEQRIIQELSKAITDANTACGDGSSAYSDLYDRAHARGLANARACGALQGLVDAILTFGLEGEMD